MQPNLKHYCEHSRVFGTACHASETIDTFKKIDRTKIYTTLEEHCYRGMIKLNLDTENRETRSKKT